MRPLIHLLGGLLALGWTAVAVDYFTGARRAKSLEQEPPFAPDDEVPPLSVVIAACNEEEKLPRTLRSLAAQDYPGPYEMIVVDDRSDDATGAILDDAARRDPRLHALHVRALPPGWLGKTHALWQGAHRAAGRWILFTDADIVFSPDCLRRAVACAEREGRDHLVVFFRLELRGFWEHVFGLCFTYLFHLRFRAWRVRDPKSKAYLGVGGFNLVRRDAYQAIGTHRALALEVADDMELGRRLKEAGFRADVLDAGNAVTVRWQEGLSGLMGGLIKNAYAGLNYSPVTTLSSVSLLLLTMVWPAAGLLLSRSRRARAGYALALAGIVGTGAHHARRGGIPVGYALTLPFSPVLLVAVMLRSAYLTERRGGVTWRNTFYPLPLLRSRPLPAPPPPVA